MLQSQATLNHLAELRLGGIRESISARLSEARKDGLGHDEFLNLLLQDELDFRSQTRVKRLLKRAAFRQQATLEQLDYSIDRSLDKPLLRTLATNGYLLDGTNLVIMGPTGVGKTYLATALGNTACRAGHSTLFYRMNNLIENFQLARAKGTYLNLLKRLAGCELLILDDFGIKPLEPQQYQDLYDVLDERGEEKSIVLTTQLPPENWNEVVGDPVTCEAITDRIQAGAMRIEMRGASYRHNRKRRRSKVDKE